MNIRLRGIAAAFGIGVVLVGTNAMARSDEMLFRVFTGVDSTCGDYGGGADLIADVTSM